MVLESALLDVDVMTATALREREADLVERGTQAAWCEPAAAQRSEWRRHRAEIEQGRKLHTPWGVRRRRRLTVLAGACSLARNGLAATGLLPVLTRRALAIRRTEIDLTFAHLPAAFDGYRILQISDPHFDALDGIADAIRACAAGAQADLCVFTGDYRASEAGAFREASILGPMAEIVEEIAAPDGTLAILGNHDTHEMLEPLESIVGARVLTNEQVEITRAGQTIELFGFDDPYRFYSASTERFVASLTPSERFRIMLVHTPDLAQKAADLGAALYLCGHTHGGQICLPGGRPIVQHLHKESGLGRGLWRRGAMVGYTSLGAGVAGSLPIRLFAPAEITLFRLRRSA
jgi:predicted MPP superfamily phosphohydrolase